MKHLKFFFILTIIIFSFGFAILQVTELYTEKTIKSFAHHTVESVTFNRGWNPWVNKKGEVSVLPAPIYLGSLLYANVHTQKPDTIQYWGAGKYTDKIYKNGWRKMLAQDQELANKALEEFGPYFIEEFDSAILNKRDTLLKKHKSNKAVQDSLQLFTTEKYWERQYEIFSKYEDLTNELLKLDNSTLMIFIDRIGKEQYPCCGKGPAATEVHAWLFFKKLIGKMPYNLYNYNDDPFTEGGWYYEKYPVDLLLLCYRMQKDFPQWYPNRFLNEVQKFTIEVKKILLSNEQESNTDN